jgi:site-specific recombinase XerD
MPKSNTRIPSYRKHGEPTGELPSYKSALRPLRDLYGSTSVASFNAQAMKAVRAHMVEKGWARKTVNKQCYRVRRVFRWGLSEELVPPEVVTAIEAMQGLQAGRCAARETAPVGAVCDTDVERTLPFLPAVVADMVRFQRLTGARPGEVCSMRPCDIDTTHDVWEYRPARHKCEHHGQQRVIMVGKQAQQVIERYLDRPPAAPCFNPLESEIQRRGKAPHSEARRPKDEYTADS